MIWLLVFSISFHALLLTISGNPLIIRYEDLEKEIPWFMNFRFESYDSQNGINRQNNPIITEHSSSIYDANKPTETKRTTNGLPTQFPVRSSTLDKYVSKRSKTSFQPAASTPTSDTDTTSTRTRISSTSSSVTQTSPKLSSTNTPMIKRISSMTTFTIEDPCTPSTTFSVKKISSTSRSTSTKNERNYSRKTEGTTLSSDVTPTEGIDVSKEETKSSSTYVVTRNVNSHSTSTESDAARKRNTKRTLSTTRPSESNPPDSTTSEADCVSTGERRGKTGTSTTNPKLFSTVKYKRNTKGIRHISQHPTTQVPDFMTTEGDFISTEGKRQKAFSSTTPDIRKPATTSTENGTTDKKSTRRIGRTTQPSVTDTPDVTTSDGDNIYTKEIKRRTVSFQNTSKHSSTRRSITSPKSRTDSHKHFSTPFAKTSVQHLTSDSPDRYSTIKPSSDLFSTTTTESSATETFDNFFPNEPFSNVFKFKDFLKFYLY